MDQTTQTPPAQPTSYIQNPAPKKDRTGLKFVLALFVGMPAVLFWITASLLFIGLMNVLGEEEEYCNVARVPLHGIITTTGDGFTQLLGLGALSSADSFVREIQMADQDEYIDAIIIDIDSPGGTPVAADEMMSALDVTNKPVVSVIRDVGASAAYWVAAGTDYIIASPASNVGSIGVTMSYLETASSSDIEGARWVDLSSGAFKDAGRPERTLRQEEQKHFKTQVNHVHEYMVERIAYTREAISHEELSALADGRAYVGVEALRLKLIDELGGFGTARRWLAEQLGTNEDDLEVCAVRTGGLGDWL